MYAEHQGISRDTAKIQKAAADEEAKEIENEEDESKIQDKDFEDTEENVEENEELNENEED